MLAALNDGVLAGGLVLLVVPLAGVVAAGVVTAGAAGAVLAFEEAGDATGAAGAVLAFEETGDAAAGLDGEVETTLAGTTTTAGFAGTEVDTGLALED